MATNLWRKFAGVVPVEPKNIVKVVAAGVGQTAGGGRVLIRGAEKYSLGQMVWVRGGIVLAEAPDLPHTELEI